MNILNESILIRQRFHDFQKFASRYQDISMSGFLSKELPEWNDLCDESKDRVIKAYHCVIGISSVELPIKTPIDEKICDEFYSQVRSVPVSNFQPLPTC